MLATPMPESVYKCFINFRENRKRLRGLSSLSALDLNSMIPVNLFDRPITTLDKVELNAARCISDKNGGTLKTYQARHKDWGPVVYKQLIVTKLTDEDRFVAVNLTDK